MNKKQRESKIYPSPNVRIEKLHNFIIHVETNKMNVRDYLERIIEPQSEDDYFIITKVEVV